MPLFNATERAIYENQVVTDRKKQEQDKAKAKNPPGLPLNQNVPPPAVPPVLSDAEVTALLSLAPAPRMAKVFSLPAGEYGPLRHQLSPVQRTALEQGMSPEQRETLLPLIIRARWCRTSCCRAGFCVRSTASASCRK